MSYQKCEWEDIKEKMQEERIQIPFRIDKSKLQLMDNYMKLANTSSRNEFIEKAIEFYASHLFAKTDTFLPSVYAGVLDSRIQLTEDRISRLLFKNAVELSMMMNVLSATLEIDEEQIKKLRGKCIKEVKSSTGSIQFEDVIHKYK